MKPLRPHQVDAHEGLREGFRVGQKRGLLVIPTGGGKTVTALEMLRQTASRGKRGLFLCDRRVLVAQAAREARDYGLIAGIVMADAPHGYKVPDAPVQFASKDTLMARYKRQNGFWSELPPADLIVTDEAHRSMAETWEALMALYPAAYVVGLTATPARGDGKGLGRRYEFLVTPTSYSELIAAKVLTPARCFSPKSPEAESKPGKRKKKSKPKRSELVGDVVGWWQRLAAGRRTFVFASGVKHSMALRDQFRAEGIAAEHLDGDTPDDERDAVLGPGGRLATGETLVVCSCSVLKYGVDCPAVGCVQIVDGFGSLVDYLQACGRGLRASPGKEDCVVIDHAGAVLYHGFPDADRQWTLDDATDQAKEYRDQMAEGKVPTPVTCPECSYMYSGRPDCPMCGHRAPRPQAEPVATDSGQLFEVDRQDMYDWRDEDLIRGWRDAVYAAAHGDRSMGVAAGMFSRRFGLPPWRVDGLPVPEFRSAWKQSAREWKDKLFAKQGAA